MKRRNLFSLLVLSLTWGGKKLQGQQTPAAVNFQALLNPPLCPLCKTKVKSQSVFLTTLDPPDNNFTGGSLNWPILVCPNCGIIFCVKNTPNP